MLGLCTSTGDKLFGILGTVAVCMVGISMWNKYGPAELGAAVQNSCCADQLALMPYL